MECDSNKQGRPDDKKQGDYTIYPIQVSRFLQNTRKEPYFTGKNQAFSIERAQMISPKATVRTPLQPIYLLTVRNEHVK